MRRPLLLVLAALLVAATVPAAAIQLASRPLDDDRYTLLVMGSDMGPWRPGSVLGGRADAMHLVSVVPSSRTVSILSFPRDSYVAVPGMGSTRINASLTRGPDTAVATVEGLTGIEIDDWIVTGMSAFVRGVDEFGGVEMDVPQRVRVDNNVVDPGVQRLDGTGSLVYGRDRKSRSDGDFGRNRAQAEVLAAMHAEVLARDPSPVELAGLVRDLRRYTVTSITPGRMAVLAGLAMEIDPADVVRRQASGRNANRGGAAVVVLTGEAEALIADLRDDGMFER